MGPALCKGLEGDSGNGNGRRGPFGSSGIVGNASPLSFSAGERATSSSFCRQADCSDVFGRIALAWGSLLGVLGGSVRRRVLHRLDRRVRRPAAAEAISAGCRSCRCCSWPLGRRTYSDSESSPATAESSQAAATIPPSMPRRTFARGQSITARQSGQSPPPGPTPTNCRRRRTPYCSLALPA